MRIFLVIAVLVAFGSLMVLGGGFTSKWKAEQKSKVKRSDNSLSVAQEEVRIYYDKDLQMTCNGNRPSNKRGLVRAAEKSLERSKCTTDIHTTIRLFQGKPYRGFCFNIPKHVTREQKEEAVFQWLSSNSDTTHYNNLRLVTEALAGVWPCNSGLTPSVQIEKQKLEPATPLVEQRPEPANPFDEPNDPD